MSVRSVLNEIEEPEVKISFPGLFVACGDGSIWLKRDRHCGLCVLSPQGSAVYVGEYRTNLAPMAPFKGSVTLFGFE